MTISDKIRGKLVADYVAALELGAVVVVADIDDGPTTILAGSIVSGSKTAAAPGDDGFAFIAWCPNKAEAIRVHTHACAALARFSEIETTGGAIVLRCKPIHAAAQVMNSAAFLNVVIQTDDELRAEAVAIVTKANETIEQMRCDGRLSDLNKQYREYRLMMVDQGRRPNNYHWFLAKHRATVIKLAAKTNRTLRAASAQNVPSAPGLSAG